LKNPPQSSAIQVAFQALKIASFFTVVIPALMLVLKMVLRRNCQFHTIKDLSKTPHQSHDLFVFGDVHGELKGFQENLEHAGIIDPKSKKWAGGSATAIQMGDVIDRGPLSKEVYHYLAELQSQATQTGGKVVRLIGNHELMFLQKNYGYADFGNMPNPTEITKQMREDIKKGRVQLAYSDGVRLYVHAGLRSAIKEQLIEEMGRNKRGSSPVTVREIADYLNTLLRTAVEKNDFSHMIFQVGKSRGGDEEVGGVLWEDVGEILKSKHARDIRQVIAHNPPLDPSDRPIRATDSMRLINVDAGLRKNYGGHNAYLKITDDTVHIEEKIAGVWKEIQRSDKARKQK
jgi:hypothetical protein